MSQRTFIFSTCGTSILTHAATGDERRRLLRLANLREADLLQSDREFIEARVLAAGEALEHLPPDEARHACAELNALAAFYADDAARAARDLHLLAHSDTYEGKLAAECVAEVLRRTGTNVEILRIEGLRASDAAGFSRALSRLARETYDLLSGYRDAGWRIVFQLSGGYKALQGFLQTVGMFFADEIMYIFEGTNHLLRIPRLPIDLDAGMAQMIRTHFPAFRQFSRTGILFAAVARTLPELCIEVDGDEAMLSPWGELCWARGRDQIYSEAFLDPQTAQIKPGDAFLRAADACSAEELRWLNERMDDLHLYLAEHRNLNRLDFKRLRGNPCPPSTHEFDAWARSPGYRVFCHQENGAWVLDRLAPGLH